MSKLYFPLSLAAVAVLAACTTSSPVTPAPAPVVVAPAPVATAPAPVVVQQVPGVVTPSAIRPGFGRVETITAVQPSAGAGGTTMRRLGIKMEDGTVQYVDSVATGISVGERVELTGDGHVKH
jgi:hypothetical protein